MGQIDRFKGYIFHKERESLEQLQDRLEDIEQRAFDVAEVLPRSILLSQEDEDKHKTLVATLREPVAASIRDSIRADPDSFANALFPVLGPTIRKAVGEAMRALSERLNRTMEHSFSRQGIRWRWESFTSGTPLLDIILRDTLVYRVEQIFVVERESGMLRAHVQSEEVDVDQDSDAVSAMLTAIQDFVRDSFGAYEQTDLNTVQIGGRTVWIHYGPTYMLASVFFGNPNAGLRPDFHAANEAIHRLLGVPVVSSASLTNDAFEADIEPILQPLLTSDSRLGGESKDISVMRFAKPMLAVMIFSALLFVWFKFDDYRTDSRVAGLISSLSDIPGVVVLGEVGVESDRRIRLLKDPSVQLPQNLILESGLSEKAVKLDIHAFQSSDPDVLLSKIRVYLKAPDSVSVTWQNGVLNVSGDVSEEWATRVAALPFSWLGVERVDFSGIRATH